MTQRVAKVQNLAESFLGGVLRHYTLLYGYRMRHQRGPVLLVQVTHPDGVPHGGIGNQTVLDDLGKARPQFTFGQGAEKRRDR